MVVLIVIIRQVRIIYSVPYCKIIFYVKPFLQAGIPERDREFCVAAHLFSEETVTIMTKTETDWLE